MSSSPLRLAATCIPVRRSSEASFEVLMVRRNPNLSFGGLWTFPGGTLEAEDGTLPTEIDERSQDWGAPWLLSSAAQGAQRETQEETSLTCPLPSLAWFSHWVPPLVGPPKRFATWFFLAPEHHGEIIVDTRENDEARWISPSDALAQSGEGEFPLTVPTWVTLDDLRQEESLPLLLDRTVTQGARFHHTRAVVVPEGRILCWSGDAAFETGDIAAPGPRNRVLATTTGTVIERFKS